MIEPRDTAGERIAAIIREVPHGPLEVLRRIVAETLLFCQAHSAGISLIANRGHSRHTACVGPWARGVKPLDAVVPTLESQVFKAKAARTFTEPGESFAPLREVDPPAIELMATPFRVAGRPCGVLWIVLHDTTRHFHSLDVSRLGLLERCAGAAFELALHATIAGQPPATAAMPESQPLSPREREVLILVARGHTSRTIGDLLKIGPKSVDTYRRRICDKLNLLSRADFVTYAVRRNLL